MRHTKYAAKLPTRTALRKTANRTRASTLGHVPNAVAVIAATAVFAAGVAVAGFALALAVTTLPAHPVALLALAFVTTFALYTVPLLTLRAAARAACVARATA